MMNLQEQFEAGWVDENPSLGEHMSQQGYMEIAVTSEQEQEVNQESRVTAAIKPDPAVRTVEYDLDDDDDRRFDVLVVDSTPCEHEQGEEGCEHLVVVMEYLSLPLSKAYDQAKALKKKWPCYHAIITKHIPRPKEILNASPKDVPQTSLRPEADGDQTRRSARGSSAVNARTTSGSPVGNSTTAPQEKKVVVRPRKKRKRAMR